MIFSGLSLGFRLTLVARNLNASDVGAQMPFLLFQSGGMCHFSARVGGEPYGK